MPSLDPARPCHDLIDALESGGPPPNPFGHREHIRLAWQYVRAYPLPEAIDRCRAALRGLAERLGADGKYHETVTWAYLLLVQERVRRPDAPTDWEGFAERFPELFAWKPGLLDRYYRPETLWSDEARAWFVLPDRLADDAAEMAAPIVPAAGVGA